MSVVRRSHLVAVYKNGFLEGRNCHLSAKDLQKQKCLSSQQGQIWDNTARIRGYKDIWKMVKLKKAVLHWTLQGVTPLYLSLFNNLQQCPFCISVPHWCQRVSKRNKAAKSELDVNTLLKAQWFLYVLPEACAVCFTEKANLEITGMAC